MDKSALKKVLWLTNIPSPYRVDFFNEFGKNVELTVLFGRLKSLERDELWEKHHFKNFNGIFLRGLRFRTDMSISINVIRHIKNKYDFIFVTNPMSPTGFIAITYMRIRGIKFVIQGDGAHIKYNEHFIMNKMKSYALKGAHFYMATTESHVKYYKYYAETSKIIKYPFSSIYKKDILSELLTPSKKELIKAELGLPDKKMITFTGQFIKRKGLDILHKALKLIQNMDYIVMFIGGNKEDLRKAIGDDIPENYFTVNFLNKSWNETGIE